MVEKSLAPVNKKTVSGATICAALAIATCFIPSHEGNSLKAYQDVVGVYTICGGVAYVKPGSTATASQCKAMTDSTIGKFMTQVAQLVPENTTPKTLAADTSFAYNIGIVGFSHSSTLKLQNQGKIPESCEAMLKWYMAGGKDCRVRENNCYGVWQRRQDERDLCLKGIHQ